MKLDKFQKGNHLLAVSMLVVILGVVGFAGYRVMKAQDKKSNEQTTENTNETPTSTTENSKTKSWTNKEAAVKGTYADADVVQIDDSTWRMYYAIQPEVSGHHFEVYSATSSDGKTWTQESGTRESSATFPDIVKTKEGKWRIYYQRNGELKSSISDDGLTFTAESGTRIDKSNDQGLTFDNVAAPTTILNDDGTYTMVYRGTINTRYASDTPNATTQLLMWATSDDGLTWEKQGIAVDSRNSTLRGQLDGPDIVKWDDDSLHIFATNYDGVFEFVFDGTKFSDGENVFALESEKPVGNQPMQVSAPPGDPTLANINNTWFMYYGVAFEDGGIFYATLE